jgi:hypothetical protein
MISDTLYDLIVAFSAIFAITALELSGQPQWMSMAVLVLAMVLVVAKDRLGNPHPQSKAPVAG